MSLFNEALHKPYVQTVLIRQAFRPTACQIFHLRRSCHRFLDFFDNWPPPWEPWSPKCSPWWRVAALMAALRRSMVDFHRFFDHPNRHRKNGDFSNPQKSNKMNESIYPFALKDLFSMKKHDFRHPFLAPFFDFFRKWRKCEISEEYNAKRGSEPSKNTHFGIDISWIFHVFSQPPSKGHFSRNPAPI